MDQSKLPPEESLLASATTLGILERVLGGGLGLEEVAELLLVVVGLRREPGDIGGLALEEVGDEDTVLLLVGVGQDVGSLDGLGKKPKMSDSQHSIFTEECVDLP